MVLSLGPCTVSRVDDPKPIRIRMRRIRKYESYLKLIIGWLDLNYVQTERTYYPRWIIGKYCRILRTRGKKEAIRFCKERRASIYRWLTTIDSLDEGSRSLSSGLPRDLRFLKHIKDLSTPLLRLILSSLYASRGLELPPVPNTDSITSEPTHGGIKTYTKSIRKFWNTLGIRSQGTVPNSVKWKKFHFTTKSGPNGHALWSAVADAVSLPESLLISIKNVGGPVLFKHLELLRKYSSYLLPVFGVKPGRFRKVSAISDQEGKTREIAILDYWSQAALRGLHRYLYRLLRRIPQDCTFDQGSFQEKIKFGGSNSHKFYSCDLKSATDRFPMELICLVLKGRFTDEYVNSWRDIMVGYPFDSQVGKLVYSTGNPMGAYSSWASFAIAHHYVVFYCCEALGIKWSDAPYVLLGDDIVINHDALAEKYMETMRSLGVEISLEKSHISTNVWEFAKRNFYKGQEITPFPISALWNLKSSPSLMVNILDTEERKGWTSLNGIPVTLSDLYVRRGFNATFVAKKLKKIHISYHLMLGLQGRITAFETLRVIKAKYYPKLLMMLNKYTAMQAFSSLLSGSLVESLDQMKKGKPLGLIAERLVMFITGREELICDAIDLTMALPILRVHGELEEQYLQVRKGSLIPTYQIQLNETWKDFTKAILLPKSDEVYYIRNQDLMISAAFKLGGYLESTMEAQNELLQGWNLPDPVPRP